MAARGFDQLAAALGEYSSEQPREERVRDLFHRYVRFGLEHPHLYRAMFSPRLAPKLAAVKVGETKSARGARTYEELAWSKAITYGAFVSSVRQLDGASVAPSVRQGDAAKAIATLAHGLVLEFIDEGLDLGTTAEGSRMAERLATASSLIGMLLHGVLTRGGEADGAE